MGELNRLYQLGFASWLGSSAIAEGVYYGVRVNGHLVAAAGTHVISPTARLAVVGNVLTQVEYRGRGYATATTGAVTAELLRFCDQVVLNVRADNPPALQAYRRLGYQEHVRFEERLDPPDRFILAQPARSASPLPGTPQGDRPLMTAPTASLPAHDVVDLGLADEGVRRIEWAAREMPVLRLISERFERERPLAGLRIGACLHVTTETANLMRALKAGGAEVTLAASNPLSTKDDVAAALVAAYGISCYARHGEDRDTYYGHLNKVADTHPQITMDDGCDLVGLLHEQRPGQLARGLRRDRGDDDRGDPAQGDGRRRRPALPGRGRQRGPDQAPLRQPLRDRPVDPRRDPAGHEHPDRRPARGRRRLRLGGQGDHRPGWPVTAPMSRSSRSIRSARSRR